MVTMPVVTAPVVCTLETAAETPAGAPVTVRVTVPVKPPLRVIVAVTSAEPPSCSVALVGLIDSAIEPDSVMVVPLELHPAPRPAASARATKPRDRRASRNGVMGIPGG